MLFNDSVKSFQSLLKIISTFFILTILCSSTLYAIEDDLWLDKEPEISLQEPFPVVLTASRLKQHKSQAPTSMTIIDKEMIIASGAREISELFRLVPGMKVNNYSGHKSAVSYHDISHEFLRRLQVLVDGRSIYQPALARVSWSDLPVAIEDIQRIEVVRSPNAASYGANSFLGVINIITEHPDDVSGTQVSYTNGDTHISDGFIRHAQIDDQFSWKISLKQQNDDGFDYIIHDVDPDEKNYDSKKIDKVNFRAIYNFNANDYLDTSIGYSNAKKMGEQDVMPPDNYDIINTEEFYTHILWHHELSNTHALETQFNYTYWNDRNDWIGCTEDQIHPVLFPALLCAELNQDMKQERMDLQIQDTYEVNDSLRFVSGGSLDVERADSETYFSGRVYNHRQRLFSNMEWQVYPDWLINAGILVEHDSIVDVSIEPRFAINYQFIPNHFLRYTWSKATRTPDLFEHSGEWHYTLRNKQSYPAIPVNANLVPFSLPVLTPSDEVHEEKIISQELACTGALPDYHLNLDIKIYHDSMNSLIPDNYNYPGSFVVNNSIDVDLTGVEISADYSPYTSVRLIATYSYSHINVKSTEYKEEIEKTVPDHTANLMAIFRLPNNWQFSSTYYYVDETKGYDQPVDWERLDFRLAKQIKLGETQQATIAVVLQHRLDNNYEFRKENNYDSDNKVYGTISLNF